MTLTLRQPLTLLGMNLSLSWIERLAGSLDDEKRYRVGGARMDGWAGNERTRLTDAVRTASLGGAR
ncbi:hypothetical protein [Microbacterium thalli]|uniref:Uncharacterized protein n=1 Tax=Microbacterium thalli TaxID=3027921 RepID=A0ABT5SLX5_9MICO|nr:hypothetical protein [Microbacterium thalli]MDD7963136.1 hypothetical protein [Microbacterium thalli]